MKKLFFTLITVALAQLALAQNQVTLSGAASGNGNYSTLKAAFDVINGSAQPSKLITVTINSSTTEAATCSLSAGTWTSLTIKPAAGATPTVSCNLNAPLILLNGASKVKIDGLNTGGSSLTLENSNTSAGVPATPCATVAFMNEATSDTLTNCTLKGSSSATIYGGTITIYTSSATNGNNNNIISNNSFNKSGSTEPKIAILIYGTTGKPNSTNSVSDNTITGFSEAGIKVYGNANGNTYSGNIITHNTATTQINGVSVYESAGTSSNETISKNKISLSTSSTAVRGIFLNKYSSTLNIVNNFILVNSSTNSTSTVVYGIHDAFSSISVFPVSNIYHNTISLTGSNTLAGLSACYRKDKNVSVTLKNNILVNNRTGSGSEFIYYSTFADYSNYTSDYNDLYKSGSTKFAKYANVDYDTFADYKTVSGKDANSINTNPNFVSSSDLHINTSLFSGLNNTGVFISSVTTDIDGNIRSTSNPDIGADEFTGGALTWTGSGSTSNWEDVNNWNGLVIPTQSMDVTIPNTGKFPYISSSSPANCNNLTIQAGAKLFINAGKSLTISGTTTGSGIIHIKADISPAGNGSLISLTDGISAIVERYMIRNQWVLTGAPVEGQSIESFLNNDISGNDISKDIDNTIYGFRNYREAANKWSAYYDVYTTIDSSDFILTKGYSARRLTLDNRNNDNEYVTFQGTIKNGTINSPVTTLKSGWNCISNPYTSPIAINENANATNNFITANASNLDPSYAVVYFWDESISTTQYTARGNSGGNSTESYVPVGGAFLAKAKSGVTQLQFTQAMRKHVTDTKFRSAQASDWTGFDIVSTSKSGKVSTSIKFNPNMTKGLDPTYDAGFLRYSSSLAIYTKLVQDNGVNFAIQCLPDAVSPGETIVIPVGFDLTAGGSVTFSTASFSLPTGVTAVFEDRTKGVFTNLDSDAASYTTTVPVNTAGTGRFFLHLLNNTATGTDDNALNITTIYAAGNSLYVTGKVSVTASLTVSDSRGVVVGNYSLNGSNSVSLKGLSKGIYIVTLKDGGVTKTQKVVLQ